MPTTSDIANLRARLEEAEPTEDETETALDYIESTGAPEDEVGGLIIAVSKVADRARLLPRLMAALGSTSSPDKAIVLIRTIRGEGALPQIVPLLLRLVDGVPWDPERQVWVVALRALALHARRIADDRLVARIRATAQREDLTDSQAAWARRCLAMALGERRSDGDGA